MSTYAINAFTVNDTLLAGRDLLRIAKGKRLHRTVAAALGRVKRTNEALEAASRSTQMEDDPLVLGGSEEPAHEGLFLPLVSVRKSFASVRDLLKVHAQLPEGDPLGDTARALLAALFPEGASFLSSDASELDIACGRLLERAAQRSFAKALHSLGCDPHLKAAKAAYSALVEARQAAADAPVESKTGDNLALYQAALEALRDYARLVEAHALIENVALDRVLLAPLANRRLARKRTAKPSASEPANDDTQDQVPPSRVA
jgi:hypothetical protein